MIKINQRQPYLDNGTKVTLVIDKTARIDSCTISGSNFDEGKGSIYYTVKVPRIGSNRLITLYNIPSIKIKQQYA